MPKLITKPIEPIVLTKCISCDKDINDKYDFCPWCGSTLDMLVEEPVEPSEIRPTPILGTRLLLRNMMLKMIPEGMDLVAAVEKSKSDFGKSKLDV